MSKFEVSFEKSIAENYIWLGYEELTRKVLNKCANKKDYGLVGKITIVDAEPSKRVFLENENGDEFTIRYFIQNQNEKEWSFSYTLYKQVDNGDGSSHGEEISFGVAKTKYVEEY